MAKQTAVEWLEQRFNVGKYTGKETIEFLFETAKEMEREQIQLAYIDGADDITTMKYNGMKSYYENKYGK